MGLKSECVPRSHERLDADRRRRPGIDRGSALALGWVVAPTAAGRLAGRARRVGRAAAAALAALTAPATHSRCVGHVDFLAQANRGFSQAASALMLAQPSILCRSQQSSKRRGLQPSGHQTSRRPWSASAVLSLYRRCPVRGERAGSSASNRGTRVNRSARSSEDSAGSVASDT